MNQTILLIFLLNICHFLGDYTHLSTNWMLSAKRLGKPIAPIAVHALIHTVLMQIVMLSMIADWGLIIICMAIQFVSHLCIDVLKGRLNGWFPQLSNPANKFHWYIFGVDQFLHQTVILFMVSILLN